MTRAYLCVMIAGLMPILWAGIGKVLGRFQIKEDNKAPRAFFSKASGKAQRANWAQLNSWESFAPFAAAVIIAYQAGVRGRQIDQAATVFIVARALYGITYIFDWASARTIVYIVGIAANLSLYAMVYTR